MIVRAGSDCGMIPDIFLSDRQLISLVALHRGIYYAFIPPFGTNSAPCTPPRGSAPKLRAREENPGRRDRRNSRAEAVMRHV